MKPIITGIIVAIACAGCGRESPPEAEQASVAAADAAYVNGRIYTLDAGQPWVSAIAVRNGTLVAVGTDEEINGLVSDTTTVVDLGERMVMPGIHDTHVHPMEAGVHHLYECGFGPGDLDAALAKIRECVGEAAPGEWIRGGQWDESFFASGEMPKAMLDAIAPDNPVFLMDWSVHNAWVNSAALREFGIDESTPDPTGGVIVRDADSGEATGVLYDNAAYNHQRTLPRYSLEQWSDALRWSLGQLAGYGVTSFKDAIVTTPTIAAYDALNRSGELTLRAKASLSWKSAWANSHDDEMALIAKRAEYAGGNLDTSFAKIMLDGIPPTYTAVLVEPYEPSERFGDNHNGKLMLEPDELIRDVVELDSQGITVKIHATGDGSARAALNAFEAAREANGDSGLIHEVSHAEMIHPDDIARFKALNVAAEMCPIIWYPLPGLDWETWLGKDRVPVWQIRTIYDSGALVTYGSDWPVVPTPNPWPGIEAMVTRSDPYDQNPGADYPSEAVDLETALRIFTLNSAIADKAGETSGSLEVGKNADFIVLDRNVFEVPIEDVGQTEVLLTVVGGQAIHGEL